MFSSNLCVICSDSISDPVCRGCYIKQTEVLLNNLNLNDRTNRVILNEIITKFPIETLNDTKCILCRRENVTLCLYCFSIILTNILRKLNFSEDLIENFGYIPIHEEFSLEDEMTLCRKK